MGGRVLTDTLDLQTFGKRVPTVPAIIILSVSTLVLFSGAEAQLVEWPVYGGDAGGTKYSVLADVNRDNVTELQRIWTWKTGEREIPAARVAFAGQPVRPGAFQATPIMLNDTLYVSTPYSRVVALDATTGEELWSYDPRSYDWGQLPRGCRFCHRGVAMWTDGEERRIFINTRWRLIALNAATGKPVESFGINGEVDLTADLVWEINRLHYTNTSPPVVWEDLVILGSGMPDNRVYKRNPPGDLQAFDARTGQRVWKFNTIPQEGEFGNETWEDGSWSYTGATNVWGPFTVDAERGLVYFPVGTPNNDFYGGHRKGDNLFAESVLCLDARTGKRVWHFQTVRHGVWDYDLPAPPNLMTITVDGETIDAVAVVAKTGFTYVFDRVTGEPVWPIEDRSVEPSDVPDERLAPTQPFPTKPAPFGRQGFTIDDLIDFTPELRAKALELVKAYRMGSIFTPPSLEGTVLMPGVWGAANWGGAGFDPTTNTLYVFGINWPHVFKLRKPEEGEAEANYVGDVSGILSLEDGIPVHKPPYTTLTAIDMNSGEHRWQVPFGDAPQVRNHPLLRDLDLPPLGMGPPTHGQSGPLITDGGLLFMSGGGRILYGLDKNSGQILWQHDLGAGGHGNPMTYRTSTGRQFLVIATGREDATLIALALPTGDGS